MNQVDAVDAGSGGRKEIGLDAPGAFDLGRHLALRVAQLVVQLL